MHFWTVIYEILLTSQLTTMSRVLEKSVSYVNFCYTIFMRWPSQHASVVHIKFIISFLCMKNRKKAYIKISVAKDQLMQTIIKKNIYTAKLKDKNKSYFLYRCCNCFILIFRQVFELVEYGEVRGASSVTWKALQITFISLFYPE